MRTGKGLRGAGFDLAERTVEWTVDPLNLIQTMLAEGFVEWTKVEKPFSKPKS
jgi:hypothetical protein